MGHLLDTIDRQTHRRDAGRRKLGLNHHNAGSFTGLGRKAKFQLQIKHGNNPAAQIFDALDERGHLGHRCDLGVANDFADLDHRNAIGLLT